jgi:hypothetical protein
MKAKTPRTPSSPESIREAVNGMTRKKGRGAGSFFVVVAIRSAALFLALWAGTVQAQTLEPGQKVDPASLEWPRFYATNGYEFAVYQPCIAKWPGNQMEGRFVVAVRPAGTTNETYGVVFFKARTEIDKVNRLVTLEDLQITKADFPTQRDMQNLYIQTLESFRKNTARVIPLDHLEAVFAASGDIEKAKAQEVKNDPPRIIYTIQPSLLVLVDGAPILKPLVGDYERVVNTRPVLLWNKGVAYPGYYLYAANRWYSAPSLDGPWSVSVTPPADLQPALDAAIATKQVDLLPPEDASAMPSILQVYVSTTPAELIETQGAPNLVAIGGTDLLHVANSSSAIFYFLDDTQYYVLISGRWFKAASLYGPWAFVAPGLLPGDFQRIPADHEKSNVLASVPGTPQAQEAVIANSIPQTATIQCDQAKLAVAYEGAPSFAGIPSTPLTYAVNTATPVIRVSAQSYYACEGGVWFVAASALGPWVVATSVPGVIYTIPPSSPVHYVTYSYVYGYAPGVVYVGYTPGYAGTVIAPGGVVVYGTGYYYPPVVVGATCISYPPTYGYGASMALGMSVGFAFGYAAGASSGCWCQPHWGCYAVATPYSYAHVNVNSTSFYTHWGTAVHASSSYGYNAYTGTSWNSQHASTFNPYTGTSASASRGAAYNPYTGNAAVAKNGSAYNPYSGAHAQGSSAASANKYTGNYSGSKQASGYNPSTGAGFSGSSSVSGNAYSGNYNANRQGAGANATTGNYGAAQTSVSGNAKNGTAAVSSSGTVGNTKTGNSASWNNGNMYADKNGNMYNYNQSSGAQKYNSSTGSYQPVSKSSTMGSSSYNRSSTSASSASHPYGGSGGSSSSWADRAGSSQSLGSQRSSSFASAGGGGWGGSRGGGGGRR